jgi:predicted DNA-binding transcriptional regulator YafY
MKIDRLISIITVFLQEGKSTAPELAKRFRVSTRTIFRDVEAICKAGVPLAARQGGGGGISIAEEYRLNRSALTADELRNLLAGLDGTASGSAESRIERLIEKLAPGKKAVVSMKDSIVIDLDSHYKANLSDKIALIRTAVSNDRLLGFAYYSERGREARVIEPYYIAFKWSAWYVLGYCTQKEDFRLFRLNRLWNAEVLGRTFTPREIPEEGLSLDDYFEDSQFATVLFDKTAEHLVVEEYGPDSYEKLEDGRLTMKLRYTNRKYIVRWLLGFGSGAVVLNPPDLVAELQDAIIKMHRNYRLDR